MSPELISKLFQHMMYLRNKRRVIESHIIQENLLRGINNMLEVFSSEFLNGGMLMHEALINFLQKEA